MTHRLERIKSGCLFVSGLLRDGREKSVIFPRAIKRLKDLLEAEINGEPETEEDLFEEAKKIFASGDSGADLVDVTPPLNM